MKIVIRTDASIEIGTGHVMRCIALAIAIKSYFEVVFICRELEGNLISYIENCGFNVHSLKNNSQKIVKGTLKHSRWLGTSQQEDAEQSKRFVEINKPDWLIVDHYSLDYIWHGALKSSYKKLMVIDDLADRTHFCDLLLDQSYGRFESDYKHLVPLRCRMLFGPQYALLRSEFSQWREFSLKNKSRPVFRKLLITMGGVDSQNVTGQVLTVISQLQFHEEINIIVVMGITAPHFKSIQSQAEIMPHDTCVLHGVDNMAEIMSTCDISIGAAGSTTWERACLGLPSIQIVVADNQKFIAEQLEINGIIAVLKKVEDLPVVLERAINESSLLSIKSSGICDGLGTQKIVRNLIELSKK